METITVTLKFKDEKKWSVRYDAEDEDASINTLYIRKSELKAPYPKFVEVTVVEPEDA